MKKIEINDYYDNDTKQTVRALFFDGKVFDWNIDIVEIEKARQACTDSASRKAIHANIQDHFIRCLTVFLGRPVTLKEVNEAIEKGEIND